MSVKNCGILLPEAVEHCARNGPQVVPLGLSRADVNHYRTILPTETWVFQMSKGNFYTYLCRTFANVLNMW